MDSTLCVCRWQRKYGLFAAFRDPIPCVLGSVADPDPSGPYVLKSFSAYYIFKVHLHHLKVFLLITF
jgi:hypothetical protein